DSAFLYELRQRTEMDGPRYLNVEPRLDGLLRDAHPLGNGIALATLAQAIGRHSPPVRQHEAAEAEIILQDLREQVLVLRELFPVDEVVRGHHAADATVAGDHLEMATVGLTGSLLVDFDV